MMSMSDGGYDDGYTACDCFWGNEPGSYVRKMVEVFGNISGLRILDIGCGEGKNAAFLAEKGAEVTAIDISSLAIERAKRIHTALNVEWVCADATTLAPPAQYFDVVVAYGLFHCLHSGLEIASLHHKLFNATKLGGRHVVCCFNDRSHDLSAHPNFDPCLLPHGFYAGLYGRGWTLENVSDQDLFETHPHNGIPHHHSLTRILARKES
jgi:tellurite methyltransferase